MKWQNYFPWKILQRGREYYREGNIDDIIIDGLSLEAYVFGRELYHVHVKITENHKLAMDCSCPYNATGPCKHLAAALFLAEQEGFFDDKRINEFLAKNNKTFIKPSFSASDYDECIFNLAEITSKVCCTEEAYEKAKKLVQQQDVVLTSCDTEENNFYSPDSKKILTARIEGYAFFSNGRYPLKIVFSEDDILAIECSVPRAQFSYFAHWSPEAKRFKFNAYLMAFLFLIDAYIKENNPGDYTSTAGRELLELYSSKPKSLIPVMQKHANARMVQLVPRLELSEDELNLSFKIGRDKLFVVKNIPLLVKEYSFSAEHALGSKDSINFAIEKFTEAADKYYTLLREVVEEDNFRTAENMKYRSYGVPVKSIASGNSILLFGKTLDSFYELASGTKIEATCKLNDSSKKLILGFRDKNLDVTLILSPDMNKKHSRNQQI